MTLRDRLDSMMMKPEDWTELSKTVTEKEYHDLVMDYQKREEASRPRCESLFKLCRWCDHESRCCSKEVCRFKRSC